jgi:3-hydroxyisobutyrate dehydrogenase-like beta-hydroxyacid dehydrogenase
MRVGFIGLGRMGTPIVRNLVAAGFEVTVWNRTKARADELAGEIAVTVADDPARLAAASEVSMTMVADDAAVEAIYLGRDGVAAGIADGAVAMDLSTVAPPTSRRLAAALRERGADFVDSPVSGSTGSAAARQLMLMVGGEEATVARVRPVLDAIGSAVHHLGPVGAGATMKLAVNSIIFGINAALSEALVLAERAGIDRLAAYEVFASSAIAAPVVHYRRPAFERPGEGPVSFSLDLGVKDLRLIAGLAAQVGAPMPQAATNLEIHDEAARDGFGDWDLAGLAECLRRRAASQPAASASSPSASSPSATSPSPAN